MYILYETAAGYALLECHDIENVGRNLDEVSADLVEFVKFSKYVDLISFVSFKDAKEALDNLCCVAEGKIHPTLKAFLELNVPKNKKKIVLGISDKILSNSVKKELGINCVTNDMVNELMRFARLHSRRILNEFKDNEIELSQLGLGHNFSRMKIKFDVNRSDNTVIQVIALYEKLDKDINLFFMRIREWYSWHFPELIKLVGEDYTLYLRLVMLIKDKNEFIKKNGDELVRLVDDIVNDESLSRRIIESAKMSMGTEISEVDLLNICKFTIKLLDLVQYKKNLSGYLGSKMKSIAPNLSSLIGDKIGAKLISKAGSLVNLSKFPASTIQILGAEKALFRALKIKSTKTPKYGILFNSSFVGRSTLENRGKMARHIANKCSLASRIDCFSDSISDGRFGDAMRGQIEQLLQNNFKNGVSNEKLMQDVVGSIEQKKKKDVGKKKEKRKKTIEGGIEKRRKKEKASRVK